MPVASRFPTRVTATSTAAASGTPAKVVRRKSRCRASERSGRGRTASAPAAGAGSSAGAALSRQTVQKRSATPRTKTVTRRVASAVSGVQSIQSGATISRAARRPSATTIVQRRSSGPPGAVSELTGPSRTAPKSRVARTRTPRTTLTVKAAPWYPPPNAPCAREVWKASTTRTKRARTSPTPPTSWALHSCLRGRKRSRARTARSRESATRASSGAGFTTVGCSARVIPPA